LVFGIASVTVAVADSTDLKAEMGVKKEENEGKPDK